MTTCRLDAADAVRSWGNSGSMNLTIMAQSRAENARRMTLTNPTPEQVEVARAEYDRSEDMCAALVAAAGTPVSGSTSDGHHTFDELYDYRMLYNAHAAHGWLAAGIPVVKSWKHSDGELCFGGGWFIVTATLPTGQVSNHYKAEHWGLFAVPEADLPPEYDGHTPQDAAERLRAAAGVTPRDNGKCGGCRDLGPHRNVPNCDFYEPPVQVDEAKLSRLIERHSCATLASEGRRIDQETICAECGWAFSVRADRTSPDQESRRKFDHVAHVVAEWLRGGGQ